MKFDFRNNNNTSIIERSQSTYFWSRALQGLRQESGLPLFDSRFETWAKEEWDIIFLHENIEYPGHLTGIEVDESTYTMLLLKYPIK